MCMFFRSVSIFFFLFVSLQVVAQKKAKPKKINPLFSINKNQVSVDEFIYLYKKNHPNKEDYSAEKIEAYFDLFINFKLKVEEAKRRGFDTTATFLQEYISYKDELRKPYLPDSKLADSLVKLTYARLQEEVAASHILATVNADATPADTLKAYQKIMEIRSKIVNGEDFGSAAFSYSDDPSSKSNYGSLGYFTAMQMVYPFETAAYETPVGEISQPVRTRFGYHLIKVNDRKPARGEVEVSHIMISTGEGIDAEKAKNTIFDVFDKVRAGMPWDELCQEYSDDRSSKENGGKLRPFGVGAMANVPAFEQVAFSLKATGEISDPFQSQYGWHIMRLEKKTPLAPFEVIAPSLKNKVLRDERTQISKKALQTKLRSDYRFEENVPAKATMLAAADTTLQQGKWKAPILEKKSNSILFTVPDKPVSLADFYQYAQQQQRANTQEPQKYMEELYNQYVDVIISGVVEEKIHRENPDYSFLLQEYYEGILLFEIMEKEIWNKASEDSVGQLRFFNEFSKNYQAGERVKAVIYSLATGDFRADLKKLIEEGDEKKVLEFVASERIRAEAGYFTQSDKPLLQQIPWQKGVYSLENNGMYYLAWLKEILQSGTMAFEEARPALISDYQVYLEKGWINQLKSKHTVKVNEKQKQNVFKQLQQGN